MNRRSSYRSFLPIPTRWMDNDAYGHVNNVTYYSFFDTAVNEHLIRTGSLDVQRSTAIGLVVESACRFHKPLSFPDVIEAGLQAGVFTRDLDVAFDAARRLLEEAGFAGELRPDGR